MTSTVRILEDGDKNAVWHVVGISEAENAETVLDITTLANGSKGTPVEVLIEKVWWTVHAHDTTGNQHSHLRVAWEATADINALNLTQGQFVFDYRGIGGISNNAGAGKTGNILLIPKDQTADFTVTILVTKKY